MCDCAHLRVSLSRDIPLPCQISSASVFLCLCAHSSFAIAALRQQIKQLPLG